MKQPNYRQQKKQREEAKRKRNDAKKQRKEPIAPPGTDSPGFDPAKPEKG